MTTRDSLVLERWARNHGNLRLNPGHDKLLLQATQTLIPPQNKSKAHYEVVHWYWPAHVTSPAAFTTQPQQWRCHKRKTLAYLISSRCSGWWAGAGVGGRVGGGVTVTGGMAGSSSRGGAVGAEADGAAGTLAGGSRSAGVSLENRLAMLL